MHVKQFQKLIRYLPMNADMLLTDISIKHVFLSEEIHQMIHMSVINMQLVFIAINQPKEVHQTYAILPLLLQELSLKSDIIKRYTIWIFTLFCLLVTMMKDGVNIVYQMYNECDTPIFDKGDSFGEKPCEDPKQTRGNFNPRIDAQNINVPFFNEKSSEIIEENPLIDLKDSQFKYPFSAIGLLTYESDDQKIYVGMASHIGNNVIITSANNCYSLTTKSKTSRLLFYPSGGAQYYQATNIHFPAQYAQAIEGQNSQNQMRYNYAFITLGTRIDLDYIIGSVGFNFFAKTRKVEEQTILTYNQDGGDFRLKSISCSISMGKDTSTYGLDGSLTVLSGSPIVNIVDNRIILKGIHGNSARSSTIGLCVNLNHKLEMKRLQWLQRKYGSLWIESPQDDYERGMEMLSVDKKGMSCLHVKNQSLTASSVKNMVKAKWECLQNINFRNNKIDNDVLLQITEGRWPKLTKLDLSYNLIKLQRKIMQNVDWKLLRHLNLQSNKLSGTSIKYLIIPNWKQLRQLKLGSNLIDVEGAKHIASSNWPYLCVLSLNNNKLIDRALPSIIKGNWPELGTLELQGNTFTYPGLNSLLKMMELRHNKQTLTIQISNIQTPLRSEKNNFLALMKAKNPQITFKIE